MTVTDVRAPDAYADGTRSQVLRWLKAIGDPVVADEPLLELETDKVTVEVVAPSSGILREITKLAEQPVLPSELLGRIESATVGTMSASAAAGPLAARTIVSAPSVAVRVRGLSPAVRRLLAELTGRDPADVPWPVTRPPIAPLRLGTLAARDTDGA